MTSIHSKAFEGCWSLSQIKDGKDNACYMDINGVLFSKDGTELIQYPRARQAEKYCIPHGVKRIGPGAFQNCSGITSIEIPDSVTSIGDSAFCECSGLTSVDIPGSVKSIGNFAFCDCNGLTSLVIHDGVKSIGDSAFACCNNLTSVHLPDSANDIGYDAFEETAFDICEYIMRGGDK